MKRRLLLTLILIISLGLLSACNKNGQGTGSTVSPTESAGQNNTVKEDITTAPENSANEQNTADGADKQNTVDGADSAEKQNTTDNTDITATQAPTPTPFVQTVEQPDPVVADPELPGTAKAPAASKGTWSGMSATEIVANMGVGFNMGNSFDATGGKGSSNIYAQEISWGNPQISKAQLDSIASVGFKTVRIPITWMNHIDAGNEYKIDEAWLARVAEVVDYAYDNNLVVIINVHHEDWVNKSDLATNYYETGTELGAVWKQIADYFADYDQHLVFEVMNEPRCAGTGYEWTGSTSAYKAINYLNNLAVNVIRESHKGYNDERAIMVPSYAAQCSSSIMTWWEMPQVNGEDATNIIASIHGYTPYNFCLSDAQKDFSLSNTSHTGQIDTMFKDINRYFVSKGIPAVLGETGATNSGGNTQARENWAWYISKKAAEYGIPIVLWDNGSRGKSGGECHAFLERRKGESWLFPTVIENFIRGGELAEPVREEATGEAGNSPVGSNLKGEVIWSNAEGLTSTSEWDMNYLLNISDPKFYPEGGAIAVVYEGKGEPKLMVDSEVKQQWWMPIDPDDIVDSEGKSMAVFSVDSITAVINGYGVDDVKDLRNMCVLATNGSITTYEIRIVTGE